MNSNQVVAAIENIKDPDLNISLKELNAIDKVTIDGDSVKIYLKLIQPIYWVAQPINTLCIQELRKLSDTAKFEIIISEVEENSQKRRVLPGVKNIIAVGSGKGGVGKSAVASNIAAALSLKGAKVGVLDADVYGPSQPTMFGIGMAKLEAIQTEDGKTYAKPRDKYGIKVASMGNIMERDDAAIVRGPMLAGYFNMLHEQIWWGNLDFLVFDLPPGTGDIQLTLCQRIPLSGAVVVTTPQEIALADVRRSIKMFQKVNVDVFGIVENMSYFIPPDMPDKKYEVFGSGGGKRTAEEYNTKLLGEVPLTMEMRDANDNGMPVVLKSFESPSSQALVNATDNIIKILREKNYQQSLRQEIKISL